MKIVFYLFLCQKLLKIQLELSNQNLSSQILLNKLLLMQNLHKI